MCRTHAQTWLSELPTRENASGHVRRHGSDTVCLPLHVSKAENIPPACESMSRHAWAHPACANMT